MLPIQTRLTVKPWFLQQTLVEAEKLLQPGACLVLYYRSACAALFPGLDGYCLIDFEKAPQISQGFRLSTTACTICAQPQKSGDRCRHVAALTITVLREDGPRLVPAPLLFADSTWQQLRTFMTEQGSNLRISPEANNEDRLALRTDNFSAQLSLDEKHRALLAILFSSYQFGKAPALPVDQKAVETAWHQLFKLCRTKSEEDLNQIGTTSKGQESARSLWSQLCHHLFMAQPEPEWQLRRQDDHRFTLLSGPPDSARLQLTPDREQTVNLLKQTGNLGLIDIKNPVRAYSKIYFQADGSLSIEPWLELENGVQHRRLEMREFIFGAHCSTAGKVFQPILEQEDDFSPPSISSNLPLLAFATKIKPAEAITIPFSEVPAFLDQHLPAILSGRHDPEPSLREFSINDLPDSIEVRNYHESEEWCYLSARYACGDRHLDLREIMALRGQGRQHAVGRGKWLQLKNTPLDWFYELMPERRQADQGDSTLRLTRLEMMALTSLVPELVLPTPRDQRQQIKTLLENLQSKELTAEEMPSHLRPYQQTGLAWLNHLYANGIGGILADGMGLGKTHQALALLQLSLRTQGGQALVVCPASVLPHWQDKIDSFYPGLDYTVYYGQQRSLSSLAGCRLLLTTYGVMRQDIELLNKITFGLIFYDEIQYLKNQQNATSKAAARLQGRVCFGLSGTPIENSLLDLKSIYDLCLPGLLGGHSTFQRTYVTPIEEGGDQKRLETLRRLIRPFMLRREKSAVLQELPEVIEDIRHCYLSADQQSLYRQAIDHEGQELLAAVNDMASPFPHMSFLALVQQLKQICNHPSQLTRSTAYERYRSGKWELFKEILNECLEAGMKIVVFSQYTAMLDLIEQYLRDLRITHAGLRGDTPMNRRRQTVEAFNNDPGLKVFCASLLAGGTGIDLTGAQAVIHYDRWWNAAKEEQATARVHRFGQQQAVQVFKFITAGTLEEKIHQLIAKKQNLAADAVQSDDGSIIKRLSREEIASILQWAPGVGAV